MLSLKVPKGDDYRISPLSVCSLYLMLKLHMNGKYDVIRYNWKYGISQASFNSRRDKKFFEGVAYKYKLQELIYLFVCSFLTKTDDWIGGVTSEQASLTYRQYDSMLKIYSKEFKKEMEIMLLLCQRDNITFTELLKWDRQKDSSRLFKMLTLGIIKYETFLILDRIFNLIEMYDDLSENYEWMKYSTILKAYRKLLIIEDEKAVDIFVNEIKTKTGKTLNRELLLNKAKLNGEKQ